MSVNLMMILMAGEDVHKVDNDGQAAGDDGWGAGGGQRGRTEGGRQEWRGDQAAGGDGHVNDDYLTDDDFHDGQVEALEQQLRAERRFLEEQAAEREVFSSSSSSMS